MSCGLEPPRIRAGFAGIFLIIFAVLPYLFLCASASAQAFSTGNAFVRADVTAENGLVTIYLPNTNPVDFLSYREESFLTIAVNTGSGIQYYTNNSKLYTNAYPVYPNFLANGTNQYINGKTQGTDTIRTTWQETNFDIVQDVYPVAFAASGQIVFKFRIVNHTAQQITATAQYLLDIETTSDVAKTPHKNDAPSVATRAGFFQGFQTWSGVDVPTFYVDFEYELCSTNFPGIIGTGYFTDEMPPVPERLIQPASVSIVEWPSTVTSFTWGSGNSSGADSDNAVLMQWNTIQIGGNNTKDTIVELGRSSWGTGEYCTCSGLFFAMLFHTEHIVYDHVNKHYTPNPFPVEALIFSNESDEQADTAQATLSVTGSIRILTPTAGRSKDSLSETQSTIPSNISSCGMADAHWLDSVHDVVNCFTDSVFDISLNITGHGITPPIFTNPNPCTCPIIVDCTEQDLPPQHSPRLVDSIYRFDSTFFVYDSLPPDMGLDSITYVIDPPQNAMCASVIIPPYPMCTKQPVKVGVKQNDSTCGNCIYFTFTDCAENVSRDTVCFFVHSVPGVPDTLPPQFRNLSDTTMPCQTKSSDWIVTESRRSDKGLKIVEVVTDTNMALDSIQNFPLGAASARFAVSVNDTLQNGWIVIEAIDVAGNISYDTITYCTTPATKAPILSISAKNRAGWNVALSDTQAWDRGIDSVILTNVTNCVPVQSATCTTQQIDSTTWIVYSRLRNCTPILDFTITAIDTFYAAGFCAQAFDCWHPSISSAIQCVSYATLRDTLCPDTVNVSSLAGNPLQIFVTISDNHLNANGDTNTLDEGIDSIWFCGAYNVTLVYNGQSYPSTGDLTLHGISGIRVGRDPPEYPKTISFELEVTDSTSHDSVAFACLDAVDGAGNLLGCGQPFTWVAKISQDKYPPQLTVVSPNCSALNIAATDSQMNDQGLSRVWLDSSSAINFEPVDTACNAANSVNLQLKMKDADKSAVAKIIVLDEYGSKDTNSSIIQGHTTSAEFGIYRQDLSLKTGLVAQPGNFSVPVYLENTDALPLSRKNIYAYQFSFHLTGSEIINFVGVSTTSTSSDGWTVVSVPGGPNPPRDYVITAINPSHTPLSDAALSLTKPLLNLIFSAGQSPNVELTTIAIDSGECGDEVTYNGGNDTTLAGPNYSITLPSPLGNLAGGTIVLKSFCSPIVGDNLRPDALSLAPVIPNPASAGVIISYTIPSDGPVLLELYNAIGENVHTLVAEDEQQGDYQLTLDAGNLPDGIYFLRLSSAGSICSRPVVMTR